jgi:asparagine synthase (glutamine-hydrolysing)
MMSDVPLGAFLSGGVDSSLVTALMQTQSTSRIKTFSIGFEEQDYNEAPYAEAVARHLGTDHTTEIVTPRKAMDVIPMLGRMYDEPFADSSQIPTFLVSQLARQHVTVTLSGDGGDELFGGYQRYAWALRLFSIQRRIPRPLLHMQSGLMERLPARLTGTRLKKALRVLDSAGRSSLYSKLLWTGLDPIEVMTNPADPAGRVLPWRDDMGDVEQMMLRDAETYLPDDILVKLDQASMAVSLESRVPLLDHRIYEFAWQLPIEWRSPPNEPKRPLKQILYRYVPRNLIEETSITRPRSASGTIT